MSLSSRVNPKKIFSALVLLVFMAFWSQAVLADGLWDMQAGKTGIENAYQTGGGEPQSPQYYIINFIKVFLTFMSLFFIIVVIWSGVTWMTAGGNDDKVRQAKGWLRNGIIGFVVIMIAYVIVSFVREFIIEAFELQQ